MGTDDAQREGQLFGRWLESQIKTRGMNLSEFATAVGVSLSSVSRWVHGRKPRADYLERIADVLVLDYDLVSTRAGIRPQGLDGFQPGSAEAVLLPLIRRIDWERDPKRLKMFERDLRWLIEEDIEEAP